jgi:AsmA-like C-terminal region
MAETYVDRVPSTEPARSATSGRLAGWHWPGRILAALVLLWIAAEGLSLAIEHTRLRRILTAQLESAIGRPVEVSGYHFSLWKGPVIEARSVVVGEDPRFGAEYFLRADSMVAHLRWRSLVRGRLEFGTISLAHPSLNLVRNSQGDWNLAEWLPPPSAPLRLRDLPRASPPASIARFERIEVDDGRINFKLADEKLPFAFVGVRGVAETTGSSRWTIHLEAVPWRAAVVLQQAGVIHVSGEVGGTSSRLRPAAISATWTGASLPDVLRLARDNDFGVRGLLSVSLDARTDAQRDGWTIKSLAQLQQIHRWDLALRPDNPSLDWMAQIAWRPSSPYLELVEATIDAPHSHLQAKGIVYASSGSPSPKRSVGSWQLVSSSGDIDAGDALAWARAFHPGIADDLSARGVAHLDAAVSGWPPRLAHLQLSSGGIDLSGPALVWPAHVGRLEARYTRVRDGRDRPGLTLLSPLSVWWGSGGHPEGSFHLENAAQRNSVPLWRVYGSTTQIRHLIAGAGAFGWNMARGWDVAGPFACDLRWPQERDTHFAGALGQASGWMELGAPGSTLDGALLRVPFLNLPIEQIRGRIDLKPGVRQALLASAQAFGARWRGSLERRDPSMPWQFDLAADQLSAADLDRWLNPRWRESFLDRMLPFLNSRSEAGGPSENLQAMGHLTIGRFVLAPLVVSDLEGDVALNGRRITVADADGQFYGGEVTGSFDTRLESVPSYHADLEFSRIDPSALTALTPSLGSFTAESAALEILLAARGASRSNLLSSLTCQGTARLSRPGFRGFDLSKSLGAEPANTRFAEGSADFSCDGGKIEFRRLELVGRGDSGVAGSGSLDFKGALDMRFTVGPNSADPPKPNQQFRVAGTLAAPEVSPILNPVSSRSR